jgi:hypothetical protein
MRKKFIVFFIAFIPLLSTAHNFGVGIHQYEKCPKKMPVFHDFREV